MRAFAECCGRMESCRPGLFHFSETSIDWTRWGPDKVRTRDFVIVAMSEAWAQRWLGINAPTVGAGAVAEADTLKGIFGINQDEFQRKTLVVLLPGVASDVIPEDLHRLNRFTVAELTREGIDDLLRAVFNTPRHVALPVGPRPTFEPLLFAYASGCLAAGSAARGDAVRS